MKARFALIGMVLCAVALPALAQAPGKSPIDSAREKLAAGMPEQARLNYRARLERAFLEKGISADVFVEATGDKKAGGQWPRLIIFTYLSKAAVYKLITDAKVLDEAKAAGFKMVRFTDKGNDGQWFFDLTKPGSCDQGLCWTN